MEAELGIEVGIIWIWRCRKQSGRPEHKNNICFPIFYVPLEMLIVSCGRQTSPSPRGSLPSARICFWFVTPAVHSLVCFNKKSICCFFQRIKVVVKFFFLLVFVNPSDFCFTQQVVLAICMNICNYKTKWNVLMQNS